MDNSTSKSLSSLSKYLVLYLITLLIEGKYRINTINSQFIHFKYIHIIKLSSNINMIISSLFIIVIIIIILTACYFISDIFNLKVSVNSIIQGFISVVLVFIIFQFIKLIIDITLLQVPDCDLTDKDSLINSLRNTKWFQYVSINDYLMILIGTITLSTQMYIKENKHNYYEIFIITSVFLICYLIVLL